MKTISIILLTLALIAAPISDAAQPQRAAAVPKTLLDLGTADGQWLVTIKGGVMTVEAVKVQTVSTTPGPGPGPIDPVPTDVGKAFTDALAKVTDPDKVKTAGILKSAIDPVLAAAGKGEITDLAGVKDNLPFALSLVTLGKPDWADFHAAFKLHAGKAATVAEFAIVLKAASDALAKVK